MTWPTFNFVIILLLLCCDLMSYNLMSHDTV